MKLLTKKRKEIFDILQASDKPICAKILKESVTFDLSTIYRGLDYLETNNLISSFYFGNEKYYFKEKKKWQRLNQKHLNNFKIKRGCIKKDIVIKKCVLLEQRNGIIRYEK